MATKITAVLRRGIPDASLATCSRSSDNGFAPDLRLVRSQYFDNEWIDMG